MNASLLFGIGVLDKTELRVRAKVGDFGDGNEVVDFLAIELKVEASVLKGRREVNNGLANLMDLFLGGYLASR